MCTFNLSILNCLFCECDLLRGVEFESTSQALWNCCEVREAWILGYLIHAWDQFRGLDFFDVVFFLLEDSTSLQFFGPYLVHLDKKK